MKEFKKIFAMYNDKTVRIYQAYNSKIANEALKLGTFGTAFKLERMTWIKPSFLWMMYRSGWGRKKDQEKVLAIDILREGFNEVLSNAILSTYNSEVYVTYAEWKRKVEESEVRCQWDPDRNILGDPIDRRAIQLGLRGSTVKKYVNEWVYKITDISDYVHELGEMVEGGNLCPELLPKEDEYPVEENVKRILGM